MIAGPVRQHKKVELSEASKAVHTVAKMPSEAAIASRYGRRASNRPDGSIIGGGHSTVALSLFHKDPTLFANALLDFLLNLNEALSRTARSLGYTTPSNGSSMFTACLHCESAFAAMVGQQRPSFTLLGPVMRTVEAALLAAPPTLHCVTGAFRRLLVDGRTTLPRSERDYRISTQHDRWALRGAGITEVFTLIPPAISVDATLGREGLQNEQSLSGHGPKAIFDEI